jgi:hypothetical protein
MRFKIAELFLTVILKQQENIHILKESRSY